MVFGNPASQSVKEGMFFSFEGNGREHRFWKDIVKPAGILDLSQDLEIPVEIRNRIRKKRLLDLDYDSPFRIGLCVFVSLPSGPSGPWSGTEGVRRLLGGRAVKLLESYEKTRVVKAAKDFFGSQGIVLTFHKKAWEGLRHHQDPDFNIDLAKAGKLNGYLKSIPDIPLYGIPPTRLTGPCRRVLRDKLNTESPRVQ
jgi:hypothetical protein